MTRLMSIDVTTDITQSDLNPPPTQRAAAGGDPAHLVNRGAANQAGNNHHHIGIGMPVGYHPQNAPHLSMPPPNPPPSFMDAQGTRPNHNQQDEFRQQCLQNGPQIPPNEQDELINGLPLIPPPPPIQACSVTNDQALNAMLMSWYMVGYHSGYYLGLQHGTSSSGPQQPPQPVPHMNRNQDHMQNHMQPQRAEQSNIQANRQASENQMMNLNQQMSACDLSSAVEVDFNNQRHGSTNPINQVHQNMNNGFVHHHNQSTLSRQQHASSEQLQCNNPGAINNQSLSNGGGVSPALNGAMSLPLRNNSLPSSGMNVQSSSPTLRHPQAVNGNHHSACMNGTSPAGTLASVNNQTSTTTSTSTESPTSARGMSSGGDGGIKRLLTNSMQMMGGGANLSQQQNTN